MFAKARPLKEAVSLEWLPCGGPVMFSEETAAKLLKCNEITERIVPRAVHWLYRRCAMLGWYVAPRPSGTGLV